MKKIFIVTLSFNTNGETIGWLESFTKLKQPPSSTFDFVIVDNGSKDPFVLPQKYKKQKNIHLLRCEINTGFSGGNNIGMRFALDHNADFVMIVNNDTIADSNLVEELLHISESDQTIGITVPKIYFAKGYEYHKERYKEKELGKVLWYAGGFEDFANVYSIHRGVDEVDHGQYDKTEPVSFATGCCIFFKKEVLEKVGLFDDRYFLYFEDADLNERVKNAGYQIVYVPSAVMWHINAASTGGSGNPLHDYFISRNRMLFGMTYAPLRTKLALIRESLRLLVSGRQMQKKGIKDYYLKKFNKGTYFNK